VVTRAQARRAGLGWQPCYRRAVPSEYCCDRMALDLKQTCDRHLDKPDCPDAPVDYSPESGRYGLYVHDGGSSSIAISFCPWCGTDLRRLGEVPRLARPS
jgi:hypothetical protein